jgi:hypothetical protein
MIALFALICGGSFIYGAFQTWFSSGCQLATFGGNGHVGRLFMLRTTCWDGYPSVPHAFTGGWAGTIQLFAGLFIILLGLIIQVARS